jgi:uncharacterized protein
MADEDDIRSHRLRNPGGTRGGMGEFLIGLAMLVAGGYLFMDNVVVTSYGWGQFRIGNFTSSFGIAVIPLMFGIGALFFNGKSAVGWILTLGSALAITVGIITSLAVHWRPSTMFFAIVIFVLIAGGIGLIARAIRAH